MNLFLTKESMKCVIRAVQYGIPQIISWRCVLTHGICSRELNCCKKSGEIHCEIRSFKCAVILAETKDKGTLDTIGNI